MRETPEPSSIQTGASQSAESPHIAGLPMLPGAAAAQPASSSVSPLFDANTLLSTLQAVANAAGAAANTAKIPQPERRRRRVNANTDNTLDGLVAKRTEVDPNIKRYQTEAEAIVLPDDELELRRMETDPDVSTRTCSLCGYQGKWVSEMVRHKRVHTSERPFKCRYCNRTSKWKADLIRHVAKSHGIRVVSKYSRSKAYEQENAAQSVGSQLTSQSGSPFYKQDEELSVDEPIDPPKGLEIPSPQLSVGAIADFGIGGPVDFRQPPASHAAAVPPALQLGLLSALCNNNNNNQAPMTGAAGAPVSPLLAAMAAGQIGSLNANSLLLNLLLENMGKQSGGHPAPAPFNGSLLFAQPVFENIF